MTHTRPGPPPAFCAICEAGVGIVRAAAVAGAAGAGAAAGAAGFAGVAGFTGAGAAGVAAAGAHASSGGAHGRSDGSAGRSDGSGGGSGGGSSDGNAGPGSAPLSTDPGAATLAASTTPADVIGKLGSAATDPRFLIAGLAAGAGMIAREAIKSRDKTPEYLDDNMAARTGIRALGWRPGIEREHVLGLGGVGGGTPAVPSASGFGAHLGLPDEPA